MVTMLLGAMAMAAQVLLGSGSGCVAANTYDAAILTHTDSVTRTNDAAVTARHLLWKAGSTATGVALNGASTIPIGTIDNTESSTGVEMAVLLLGRGPTKKVVASEAITVGEAVYTAASGKVQDEPAGAGTYYLVGYALTAAAADGDIIEIQDCVPVQFIVAA